MKQFGPRRPNSWSLGSDGEVVTGTPSEYSEDLDPKPETRNLRSPRFRRRCRHVARRRRSRRTTTRGFSRRAPSLRAGLQLVLCGRSFGFRGRSPPNTHSSRCPPRARAAPRYGRVCLSRSRWCVPNLRRTPLRLPNAGPSAPLDRRRTQHGKRPLVFRGAPRYLPTQRGWGAGRALAGRRLLHPRPSGRAPRAAPMCDSPSIGPGASSFPFCPNWSAVALVDCWFRTAPRASGSGAIGARRASTTRATNCVFTVALHLRLKGRCSTDTPTTGGHPNGRQVSKKQRQGQKAGQRGQGSEEGRGCRKGHIFGRKLGQEDEVAIHAAVGRLHETTIPRRTRLCQTNLSVGLRVATISRTPGLWGPRRAPAYTSQRARILGSDGTIDPSSVSECRSGETLPRNMRRACHTRIAPNPRATTEEASMAP